MKIPPALKKATVYGSVCGLFGAATYIMIAFFSNGQLGIPQAIFTGFLFWGCVGFVIGYFNLARRPDVSLTPHSDGRKPRLTVRRIFGQAVYRTLVGCLVGGLVASLVEAAEMGCAIFAYGDIETAIKNVSPVNQIAVIALCGFLGATVGPLVSGIFFAWVWGVDNLFTLIWASTWGVLMGAVGGLIPLTFTSGGVALKAALIGGGFGGAVAGVFALAWFSRKRNSSRSDSRSGAES